MKISKEQRDYILKGFKVVGRADRSEDVENLMRQFRARIEECTEDTSLQDVRIQSADEDFNMNICYDFSDGEYPFYIAVSEDDYNDSRGQWIDVDTFRKIATHMGKVMEYFDSKNS